MGFQRNFVWNARKKLFLLLFLFHLLSHVLMFQFFILKMMKPILHVEENEVSEVLLLHIEEYEDDKLDDQAQVPKRISRDSRNSLRTPLPIPEEEVVVPPQLLSL